LRPRSCTFTEIDFPGSDAWHDIAGRVHRFSGNDIPELILNEKTLRGMHPVVEIVRIELAKSERRRFRKSESGKRGCFGHCDFGRVLVIYRFR
jgi:hypothetical protein